MLNTNNTLRSDLNNSGRLTLPIEPSLRRQSLAAPLPRSARAIELIVRKAERLLEQSFSLNEALAGLTQLLGQDLPLAYCRLLLATNDRKHLIPKAEYKKLTGLELNLALNQQFPLDLLPDGPRLPKLKCSLIGPCRDSLIQEQLRDYSTALGLGESLTGLLLIPLKLEGRFLGVLEFGELKSNLGDGLNEEEVQAIIQLMPGLAAPLADLLHQPLIG